MYQLLNSLFHYSGKLLITLSWQSIILISIVWAITIVFKKARKEFHYYLWLVVIFRLCIPFNYSFPIGTADKLLVFTGNNVETVKETLKSSLYFLTYKQCEYPGVTVFYIPTPNQLMFLWLTIIAFTAAFAVSSLIYLNLKVRQCPEITRPDLIDFLNNKCYELGIERKISLHYQYLGISESPLVIGILKPKILIPGFIADSWPIEKIEPVLLHELYHIKNNDLAVSVFQIIVQTLFFFHPMVWYVNKKINIIREELCDDRVIASLDYDSKRYLLNIVEAIEGIRKMPKFGWAVMGLSGNRSTLLSRVIRIADNSYIGYESLGVSEIVLMILISLFSLFAASGNTVDKILINNPLMLNSDNNSIKLTFPEAPKKLNFVILNKGIYFIDGSVITKVNLKRVLKEKRNQYHSISISLPSHPTISYEEVKNIKAISYILGYSGIYIRD